MVVEFSLLVFALSAQLDPKTRNPAEQEREILGGGVGEGEGRRSKHATEKEKEGEKEKNRENRRHEKRGTEKKTKKHCQKKKKPATERVLAKETALFAFRSGESAADAFVRKANLRFSLKRG
ncbi:hypothetical protein T4D_15299 [Trichinella pseudospiralis]|uniref:Uncharacterized protein n=1 Tax=Trichinella pseudospiralis TaxID=6337 RepID=A0A0V1FGL3_TRIPS|nr:hypothetical protein T4D_15299 [Trichinella pseudospiralis]